MSSTHYYNFVKEVVEKSIPPNALSIFRLPNSIAERKTIRKFGAHTNALLVIFMRIFFYYDVCRIFCVSMLIFLFTYHHAWQRIIHEQGRIQKWSRGNFSTNVLCPYEHSNGSSGRHNGLDRRVRLSYITYVLQIIKGKTQPEVLLWYK